MILKHDWKEEGDSREQNSQGLELQRQVGLLSSTQGWLSRSVSVQTESEEVRKAGRAQSMWSPRVHHARWVRGSH